MGLGCGDVLGLGMVDHGLDGGRLDILHRTTTKRSLRAYTGLRVHALVGHQRVDRRPPYE